MGNMGNPKVLDDTRSRILNSAGPVFAAKGFQATTVREICQKAGVNLASVNYHFGDKERLYIETVKQAHQLRSQQIPLPEWPEGTSTQTKLAGFIRTMMTRMVGVQEAPWQTRLMTREILNPTAACTELVRDYFRPQFDRLLDILDEILPPEMPRYQRNQIGFSIVGQCLFYRVAGDVVSMLVPEDELKDHYASEQLAEHISRVCSASLGLEQPLSSIQPEQ